jgi:uncharacterized protein (TIGR02270 family)
MQIQEAQPVDEVIEDLVSEYAEQTAFLWSRRNLAVHSSSYRLSDVAELDERLAGHIEGLHVSGVSGWHHCEEGLGRGEAGYVFAAATVALETCDGKRLKRVVDAVEEAPQSMAGICSAFGWVNPVALKSTVAKLLGSDEPLHRRIGLTACALHRVDPGFASARVFADTEPAVRARALRAAGELGKTELLATCRQGLTDTNAECRFWAGWSAVLLGDRHTALEHLQTTSTARGANRVRAFRLALQAIDVRSAHGWLAEVFGPQNLRWLIQGSGIVGDPTYVPWLISHMRDAKTARVAGEAFALITGADLEEQQLAGTKPANFQSGPTDDLDDPDLDMDPDFDLPWPNPEKVEGWWQSSGKHFNKGNRYFVGARLSLAHCMAVLKTGAQYQRVLAAQHIPLLQAGTQVFNTSAPAWRQQSILGAAQ